MIFKLIGSVLSLCLRSEFAWLLGIYLKSSKRETLISGVLTCKWVVSWERGFKVVSKSEADLLESSRNFLRPRGDAI